MGKRKKSGNQKNRRNIKEDNLALGLELVRKSPLFSKMGGDLGIRDLRTLENGDAAIVTREGKIFLNRECFLTPGQWAYVVAHCRLHLAFGHFDREKMPEGAETYRWNQACDIYVAKFLADVKFGQPLCPDLAELCGGSPADERKIYTWLGERKGASARDKGEPVEDSVRWTGAGNIYGTAPSGMDMRGLDSPIVYDKKKKQYNRYAVQFAYALSDAVTETVEEAGGHKGREKMTISKEAAQWFISRYPLLGGIASSFRIIEDYAYCMREEIQVAAVDAESGEIYVNPAAGLQEEEWKFVLAHEFLHAGLGHQKRQEGRDLFLWNVACDYVINGWLVEMGIGKMPEIGVLYDEGLRNKSAEEIYDRILEDIRGYRKKCTFCGYGKGDILAGKGILAPHSGNGPGMTMDEFCKSALRQGLAYHQSSGRGYIPAGLIEEIRALSMPPVPWDVELARWFDELFPYAEKRRTYARPSRRQGATPDIPRPHYVKDDAIGDGRTFGVVIDTSGSMSAKMIGMALGSVASYAAVREVPFARVVFCDAAAYDAGYLSPEEIAGRVEVKGRGGTKLQSGVDLLEHARDFPKDGPILLITDGAIEERLVIHRTHAFLLPKGNGLPFRAKGKVFRLSV